MDSCSTFSKICKQYPTIEDMKGIQAKRRILLLQFCLVILMHPIKNATVGNLLQDHIQKRITVIRVLFNYSGGLINSLAFENSHKDHIENE